MCGIAGVYARERDAGTDLGRVRRMLSTLEHRGPDGEGILEEDGVVLGHRRLAIIDPSERGAQPMSDWTGRYVITYNGEVYNYVELRTELERLGARFTSSCDTEVLVNGFAVWGRDCLERLNGMFAFAIYDRVSGELFCARDRLGVKPFVYTDDGRRFAFASEPKALLEAGLAERRLDPDAVYSYIARGYADPERSLYADIRSLPPGHVLEVTRTGARRPPGGPPLTTPRLTARLRRGRRIASLGRGETEPAQRRGRGHVPLRRARLEHGAGVGRPPRARRRRGSHGRFRRRG